MSDLKAFLPVIVIIFAMAVVDQIFDPSSWILIAATALATSVYHLISAKNK